MTRCDYIWTLKYLWNSLCLFSFLTILKTSKSQKTMPDIHNLLIIPINQASSDEIKVQIEIIYFISVIYAIISCCSHNALNIIMDSTFAKISTQSWAETYQKRKLIQWYPTIIRGICWCKCIFWWRYDPFRLSLYIFNVYKWECKLMQ